MSDSTFHPGGILPAECSPPNATPFQLMPGEEVIPLRVLQAHWEGDSSELAEWTTAHGVQWSPEGVSSACMQE